MAKFNWRRGITALAVVPLLALGACSSTGGKTEPAAGGAGGQVADTPRLKIAMITHAAAGDTFWDIVRKGAETAAKKDNVELLYSGDAEGGRQAQLVQQAIDQKVDGIVVTLAKPEALKDAVKKAVDAGIPVVSFNAGEDESKAMGAITHFGQSDKLAGVTVGKRLATEGIKHPICVVQEQGHVGLENRCAGIKEERPRLGNSQRQRRRHDVRVLHRYSQAAVHPGCRRDRRAGRTLHTDHRQVCQGSRQQGQGRLL